MFSISKLIINRPESDMNMNELIASKIKETRVELGYSCEYMANKLGISKGAYSNMENGKIEISITRLELLSKAFQIPIETFLPNNNSVTQISNGSGNNINVIHQNILPLDEIEKIKDALRNLETLYFNRN